jgi:hypothetical protein
MKKKQIFKILFKNDYTNEAACTLKYSNIGKKCQQNMS